MKPEGASYVSDGGDNRNSTGVRRLTKKQNFVPAVTLRGARLNQPLGTKKLRKSK